MGFFDLDSADGIQAVSQSTSPWVVSPISGGGELPTFMAKAQGAAIGNNKSMLAIQNGALSGVVVKLRELYVVNTQLTGVTGIVSEFNLFRFTTFTLGTAVVPAARDTNDVLNVLVTCATGATIVGEFASSLKRWHQSSDEWGAGPADSETAAHDTQINNNIISQYPGCKPITVRPGQGVHVKHTVNSTAGTFDLFLVFTTEAS